jgi:hypothetical protein
MVYFGMFHFLKKTKGILWAGNFGRGQGFEWFSSFSKKFLPNSDLQYKITTQQRRNIQPCQYIV